MAASTSRQPQVISAPPITQEKAPKKSRKGKQKERKNDAPAERVFSSTSKFVEEEEIPEWPWVSLAETSASQIPPVFTKDGNYFFSIVGSNVKIYSSTTGAVVSTLSGVHPYKNDPRTRPKEWRHPSSSDQITSAVLNPRNPFQLVTGSLNGCIMVWDFIDASLLQVIDLEGPITHICAHDKLEGDVIVGITRKKNEGHPDADNMDDWARVMRVSLIPSPVTSQKRVKRPSKVTSLGKTRSLTGLAISASGNWVVATAARTAYVAGTSPTSKSAFTKYVSPEKLTCLACHPSEDFFATGDEKGVIRQWYCLDERIVVKSEGLEKRAQTTALHWHAHAVMCLAFTSSGAYLLSGGEEAVLVIWQLHSGRKEFVPRVGAPIRTIAVTKGSEGSEEYLLGLTDATYVFISSGDLKIARSISRIKLDSMDTGPATGITPFAVHSLTSTLILPSSHPSSLQLYSPASSVLVAELEVSPSNRVSRQDDKPIEPARVVITAVSASGQWMATVDSRKGDENFSGEVYLKMWSWDRRVESWILNTRIDRPHGQRRVTAVTFSPASMNGTALHLVTTGEDGMIKSWGIRQVKRRSDDAEEFWVARSHFRFRTDIPQHAAWSPDGSVLAVSFERQVALFDPVTTVLLHLIVSRSMSHVVSAHFLGRGRYIVVVEDRGVLLWDLISHFERHRYLCGRKIQQVFCHPLEESFIVFHQPLHTESGSFKTRIALCRPDSDSPYATYQVPFELLNLAWYRAPSSTTELSSFTLAGITSTCGVVLFGDHVDAPEDDGASARQIAEGSHTRPRRTLMYDVFGKSAFDAFSKPASSTDPSDFTRARGIKDTNSILEGPAYLAPPLESLFEELMAPFLIPRAEDEANAAVNVDEDDTAVGAVLDGDISMDQEEAKVDMQLLVRKFGETHMNFLVDMFSKALPKDAAEFSHNMSQTNGAHAPKIAKNGIEEVPLPSSVHKSKANGIKLRAQTLASPDASSSSDSLSSLSVTANRQKRKKSSG